MFTSFVKKFHTQVVLVKDISYPNYICQRCFIPEICLSKRNYTRVVLDKDVSYPNYIWQSSFVFELFVSKIFSFQNYVCQRCSIAELSLSSIFQTRVMLLSNFKTSTKLYNCEMLKTYIYLSILFSSRI